MFFFTLMLLLVKMNLENGSRVGRIFIVISYVYRFKKK